MKKIYFILFPIAFLTSCQQATELPKTVEKIYEIDSLALAMGIDTLLLEKGRHIPLEGAVNFRDLGGIKTQDGKTLKWNKIFRSGNFSELTANDFETISKKGIKTVIDFRTDGEIEEEPDTLPKGVAHLHLPIGEDVSKGDFMNIMQRATADSMEAFMTNIYAEIPLKWSGQYKKYFGTVADTASTPVVFHCTAGKDRAGIASALLLYTLGVDMETITKEYELSNYYRYEANQKYVKMFEQFGIAGEVTRPLMGVKGNYLATTFNTIETEHGSLDDYLEKELGVNEEVKKNLKALYLE